METKRNSEGNQEGETMSKGELRLAICEENQRLGGGYVQAWNETEGMKYKELRGLLGIIKKMS